MEIIKKYKNRKLYSTRLAKYVTLDYVNDLVRQKSRFKVIENKSKKDVTKETLVRGLMNVSVKKSDIVNLIRKF